MNTSQQILLIFAAMAWHCGASAREPVHVSIVAPGESIVRATHGQGVLVFGELPESIRFVGQRHGVVPAGTRYYWTFAGGEPSRYPAHGTSSHLWTGPVKFTGPGEAVLHVLSHAGHELSLAKLLIAHVTFEFQKQYDDPANPAYSYIPEGAELGPHDELFVQADVVVKTDSPLPGVDLGRLAFDHPRRNRIVPDRAITDAHGAFATTLSGWIGQEKNPTWPAFSLELIQRTRNVAELARLLRKNDSLRRRSDPLRAPLTATPVPLYEVGMSETKLGQVELHDGYQLGFPPWLARHRFSESSSDLANGSLHLHLDDVHRDEPAPIVYCIYPPAVADQLVRFAEPLPREGNPRRAEDGHFYLRDPEVRQVIFQVAKGEFLEAVTLRPRAGHLAVLLHRPSAGGHFLAELDASTGQLRHSFPVPSLNAEHLTWMGDRYLLAAWYGRHSSGYSVVDLQTERLVKSGEGNGTYEVRGGKLYATGRARGPLFVVRQ